MLTVARKARKGLWTSELRCATGRSAICHLLHLLRLRGVDAVLIPSYAPDGVIAPVIAGDLKIKFYKLNRDLTPDLDDLSEQLTPGTLIIVIHYFGFESPVEEIVERAHGCGCYVLEDCAQAMWAKGGNGDFALWTWNKFMPVPDGAALRSRLRNIDVHVDLKEGLPHETIAAYATHLRCNALVAQQSDPMRAAHMMEQASIDYEEYYRRISDDMALDAESQESRLMACEIEYMQDEQERRTANARQYDRLVPGQFKLRDDPRPPPLFAYPIVCPVPVEMVANELVKVGVCAARQADKWTHPPSDQRYEHEQHFLRQHLLLPVDGDVTYDDIQCIEDCLQSCIQK